MSHGKPSNPLYNQQEFINLNFEHSTANANFTKIVVQRTIFLKIEKNDKGRGKGTLK